MFEVIRGNAKEKEERFLKKQKFLRNKYKELYYKNKVGNIKFAIFYGINYLKKEDVKELSFYELQEIFLEYGYIKELISLITYNDFINIFPVCKEYDGDKYYCKDYFSTIDYLGQFDLNDKIKDVDELLMNYWNNSIINFNVKEFLCYDYLAKMSGKPTILDMWLDNVDPEGKIHTYTINKDLGYIQDNTTGRTVPFKKQKKKSKIFKIVK